ncbi:hypothetical protein K438DRAFT_1099989 [Mycena galopus ATCC 62051]|nr:hypothetical protein K438DRAFT_1099989 [Mycena galopus ATCC 62051]
MSTTFKLSRRDGGLIRRVVFPPSAAKPSWNALSARIHTLFNIPIEQVAVSYIDADNDEVTLSSEDELRDYYETSPHGETIKFVVQDLNLFRDTPGNNVGEEALLVDVEDNWQRLPPLSGTEATDSDAFIPVVGSEAGDAAVPSSSRGTASPVPPTESTWETATTVTVDDPSDPPVPTINPQPLLTNDVRASHYLQL